jgi:hypothetical protein
MFGGQQAKPVGFGLFGHHAVAHELSAFWDKSLHGHRRTPPLKVPERVDHVPEKRLIAELTAILRGDGSWLVNEILRANT